MDAVAHYRHLLALGREEFLAAAAPAALVRYRVHPPDAGPAGLVTLTMTIDEDFGDAVDETRPHGKLTSEPEMELFPLAKKPGASFPDRITIGRTANNDIVIADSSVSRLHADVRRDGTNWVVADAGSKNGSWLREEQLEARKEKRLASKALLRIGEIELTFFVAADLYAALGGM